MIDYNKPPSQMTDDELVVYLNSELVYDIQWRDRHVDFDRCVELFEMKSGERSLEDNVPQENKIRRAVEDYISVALMNFPKARLTALRDFSTTDNMLERELMSMVYDHTEKTINSLVDTILKENEFMDQRNDVLYDAGIFGVGFLKIEYVEVLSVKENLELGRLLRNIDNWTEKDARKFQAMSKKIKVEWVDARDVYLQHSYRKLDGRMTRASIVKEYTTDSLRAKWEGNEHTPVEEIQPGAYPYYLNRHERLSSVPQEERITAEVTTWIIEPVKVNTKYRYIDEDNNLAEEPLPEIDAYQVNKIILAGDKVVYRKVMSYNETLGRLPLIPFYLAESKIHPYGYSKALQLEHSQKFYNLMRAMAYRSVKKAVSNQGIIVAIPNLGANDEVEIDRVLEEGGVAKLTGNVISGPVPLSDMIVPINNLQSQIQPAIMQAMQLEERSFDSQAQTLDMADLARARSGVAKRAQAAANDRPKTMSVNNISKSVEDVYQVIYELISLHYTEEMDVEIRNPGGSREVTVLNKSFQKRLPIIDEYGNLQIDQNGNPEIQPIDFVINSTDIKMKADAEGRGNIPLDPMQRLNWVAILEDRQYLSKLTAREFILDDDWIARDDANREIERREFEKQQLQQLQLAQQFQQQTPSQTPQNPTIPVTQEQLGGLAPTAQDLASDINLG